MKKMILYGAGQDGKLWYDFLDKMGTPQATQAIECFCDKNAQQIGKIGDKLVLTFERARHLKLPFVISASGNAYEEIRNKLDTEKLPYFSSFKDWYVTEGGSDLVGWNRDTCAYFHIDGMNSYFDQVESECSMAKFWGEDSIFFKMFQQLDLNSVVELACGRGRHVRKYDKEAGHITLVDILEKNISYCRDRFSNNNKILYYCNDGYDLKDLQDNSYTSIFTYDAMVHFEMMDIYSYLKDIYRILTPGALGLFHHSNNTSDYRISAYTAEQGRNYMSKDIFAYMAYRLGYEIVSQQVIDWGESKELDCLTLIRKRDDYLKHVL